MIDPRSPELDKGDMTKISNVYQSQEPAEQIDNAKWALMHPYKTQEQVVAALKQNPDKPHETLSKMNGTVRRDPEAMLQLTKITPQAYSYADINDLAFKEKALRDVPAVYGGMTQQDRDNPAISRAYLDGMLNNMRQYPLDNTTMSLQFKNRFHQDMDATKVLTPSVYEESYERMVVDGPNGPDGRTLSKDFSVVAACRLLNKDAAPEFDAIDQRVWERHPEQVIEWAQGDRREVEVNDTLTAIETIAPKYKPLIAEVQKERWREHSEELLELKAKQDAGRRLSGDETRMLAEAEKHISISEQNQLNPKELPQINDLKDRQLKEHLLKIEQTKQEIMGQQKQQEVKMEKEREENLAYLLQDSKTRVLSAASSGEIDPTMASDILGYIGSIPTTTTSSRSQTFLANTEAMENDIDNIDMDLAYSDPELSEDPTIEQELEMRDEYDAAQDYEENYAGNPFVSYVNPEGMEPTYKPYSN